MRNKLVFLLFLITFTTVAVAWQTRDNSLIFGDGQSGNKDITVQTDAGTDPAITVNTTGDHFEFNKPLDSVDIDTPDIDGGTIDGTTIGGTTPAAGSFSTADIDGGTIDGATIGGTTPGAGTFSSMTATTADIDGGTIDAVDINLGTASDSQKLVLSKESTANLDALTREQGSIYYDTTTDSIKFDDGTNLQEVGTGSGGGSELVTGVNLGENPNATTAVDNSGTDDVGDWIDSASGTTTTRTITTSELPLFPVRTTGIKVAFAAGTNDYVRYRFRVPPGARNRKLGVYWYQLPDSNFVSQTANVELYNYSDNYVTSEAEVTLSIDDSSGDTLIPDADGLFSFEFDADDRQYYEMRIINNGATTGFLVFNDVTITPDPDTVSVDVVTGWSSDRIFTATNFGTTTGDDSKTRRVGPDLIGRFFFTAGTPSASPAQIELPTGLTIDTSTLPAGETTIVGKAKRIRSGASGNDEDDYVFFDGSDINTLFISSSASASGATSKTDANSVLVTGDSLDVRIMVPIAEWAGSGTVNIGIPDREYLYNSSLTDATDTTSFAYGQTGSQFALFTAARSKRVRSRFPIGNRPFFVEVFDSNGWKILDDCEAIVCPMTRQGTDKFGIGKDVVNDTDIDITFAAKRLSDNITYGDDTTATDWSGIDNDANFLWRVVIFRDASLAGFQNATADVAGLVGPLGSANCDASVNICAGTYTPTADGASTCSSISFDGTFMYTKINDIVSFSGHFLADCNDADTVLLNLPIATANFSDIEQCSVNGSNGAGTENGDLDGTAATSNQYCSLTYQGTSNTAQRRYFISGKYQIQ